jgi:uncharacterized surface protein with fasciclin (FAS1) repeats
MKKLFAAAVVAFAVAGTNAADAEKTIVGVAAGNEDFSTLVTAVKAADLVDTLNGKGPYTVFAPNNAAFKKIPADALAAVLKDKEKLTKILKAHVVEGKVMAADAVKLNGKQVNGFDVKVEGDTVMIGNAKVIKTDITASNGVIHVIDTVLMPKE